MKNLYRIVLVAAIMLVGGDAFGQTNSSELTINLAHVYTIAVNSANATASFPMNAADHFVNGNSTGDLTDHLEITATENFVVNVIATAFTTPAGATVGVENVQVDFTSATPIIVPEGDTFLSTTAKKMLTGSAGVSAEKLQVAYTVPAANAANFLNQPAGAYVTTVTYTISAP